MWRYRHIKFFTIQRVLENLDRHDKKMQTTYLILWWYDQTNIGMIVDIVVYPADGTFGGVVGHSHMYFTYFIP